MIELNRAVIGSLAAGVAGLFIGYCIYFDNKRRADPEYKKKLRERRRRNRKSGNASKIGVVNLNDHEAIERYFLQEIQLGENLIARGEFESGVEHLANAIVVCSQPARLLQVLQTSLPAQVFAMLIMKMQEFGNRANVGNDDDGPKIIASNPLAETSSVGGLDSVAGGGGVMIDDLE